MHIEDYIPFGHKNRISRERLAHLTKHGDRTNRGMIEEALLQRDVLIVNIDNGYFRPDGSLSDMQFAKGYLLREAARTSACNNRCKAIRKCIKGRGRSDDITGYQISLFDAEHKVVTNWRDNI